MELVVDAAIVGAGIAGLSAALFLGRAGRSVIVFDGGTTRIESVEEVREHLGFDGLPPQELLSRARAEVHKYGIEKWDWRGSTAPDGQADRGFLLSETPPIPPLISLTHPLPAPMLARISSCICWRER